MEKDKNQIVILTAADSNFFPFLPSFEKNIERHFGQLPIIMDLGLLPEQISQLRSKVQKFDIPQGFSQKNNLGNISAIHKPAAVLECLNDDVSGCLYLDSDTLLTQGIDLSIFEDIDLAITPRHPNELARAGWEANGTLNSGVIYFKNATNVKKFVENWLEECLKPDQTDQLALSTLLEKHDVLEGAERTDLDGIKLLRLNSLLYNDVACKTGKVLHFKNAGRSKKKFRKRLLFGKLERHVPFLLKFWVNANRRRRGL